MKLEIGAMSKQQVEPLQAIPDPQTVRNYLGRLTREARLTRQLLRLSEALHQSRRREVDVRAARQSEGAAS